MKEKILNYFNDILGDIEEEEIDNAKSILSNYDDELRGLSELDAKLINRIVDDEEIYNGIEARVENSRVNENPFG